MSKRGAVVYGPLPAHAAGSTTRFGGKGVSLPYAPATSVASDTFVATNRPPGSTFMYTRFVSVLFSLIDATSNTDSLGCPAGCAGTVESRTADAMAAARVMASR